MKTIRFETIVEKVSDACKQAAVVLPHDTFAAFENAKKNERSDLAISILLRCMENAEIAKEKNIPICQDTGLAVFFVSLGVNCRIEGGSSLITDAINEGVRKGYREGYLRASVLSDPLFDRKNTLDNTPAIIHIDLVAGDLCRICFAPKGGGAENMSAISMMPPSAGEDGIIRFIVDTVVRAGGNPCPPVVLGIGIGGNFERCAVLAKRALFRTLGEPNKDERYALLEKKILERVNASGVGPQGLGGKVTAFAAHIEYEPCHLASLPVALNMNCHAHRHVIIDL